MKVYEGTGGDTLQQITQEDAQDYLPLQLPLKMYKKDSRVEASSSYFNGTSVLIHAERTGDATALTGDAIGVGCCCCPTHRTSPRMPAVLFASPPPPLEVKRPFVGVKASAFDRDAQPPPAGTAGRARWWPLVD